MFDAILARQIREEESQWTNYDHEELEIKFEIGT